MKVNLIKSEIPVLWLDNWFVWQTDDIFWKKLAVLVLEKKIIVLDTGQYAEMLERYSDPSKLTEKLRRILSIYQAIATPYISTDHSSFLGRQTAIAIKAYAEGKDELVFNFEDLFDPLIQELTPLLDLNNQMHGDTWGTPRKFKGLSLDISIDWASIRKGALANKETLSVRREKELLGMHDAIRNIAMGSNAVRKKNVVDYYLRKWSKNTGNDNLDKMLEFFKSDHYQAIPYVEVHSWLISDLITGAREPKSSDYFDIIMIAMALPFADYMILDKDMRGRIVDNRLKIISPKGSYKTKLIKQNEVEDLLNQL